MHALSPAHSDRDDAMTATATRLLAEVMSGFLDAGTTTLINRVSNKRDDLLPAGCWILEVLPIAATFAFRN